MTAGALVCVPVAKVVLPAVSSYMPAIGSMTILVDLLIAALLFEQARVLSDQATARLASAYLFAAVTAAPYLVAFPGTFSKQPVIGGNETALWLWWFWHVGFGTLIARHAIRIARPPCEGKAGATIGGMIARELVAMAVLAAIAVMIAALGIRMLPTLLGGGHFTLFGRLVFTPVALLATAIALALVVARLGRLDPIGLWLGVAMVSAMLDVMLTLLGGPRFSVSWYVSRVLTFATGLTVLVAELAMLVSLIGRATGLNRHLATLSLTDPLTELANRRAFDQALATEWRRAARERGALSLLLVDVDRFKQFNDRYGHPAGDACLQQIGACLGRQAQRAGDHVARIGGEEFALLLPATDQAGAMRKAAHALQAVRGLGLAHADGVDGIATISIGVATMRPAAVGSPVGTLVEAADRALYRAKRDGRARATCAHDQEEGGMAPAPRALAVA